MESRVDVLVWFVYGIILWFNKFVLLPGALGRLREYDGGQANKSEHLPPSGYLAIRYIISDRSGEPH